MDYCPRHSYKTLTRCVEGCSRAVDGNCQRENPFVDEGYGCNTEGDYQIPEPPCYYQEDIKYHDDFERKHHKHKHKHHHKKKKWHHRVRACFILRVRRVAKRFMR